MERRLGSIYYIPVNGNYSVETPCFEARWDIHTIKTGKNYYSVAFSEKQDVYVIPQGAWQFGHCFKVIWQSCDFNNQSTSLLLNLIIVNFSVKLSFTCEGCCVEIPLSLKQLDQRYEPRDLYLGRDWYQWNRKSGKWFHCCFTVAKIAFRRNSVVVNLSVGNFVTVTITFDHLEMNWIESHFFNLFRLKFWALSHTRLAYFKYLVFPHTKTETIFERIGLELFHWIEIFKL